MDPAAPQHDATLRHIKLADGTHIAVDRAALPAPSATFSAADVVVKSPDLAMVVAGRGGKFFFGFFAAMGLALIVAFACDAGWPALSAGDIPWGPFLIGLVFIGFALAGLMGWSPWCKKVTFDRRRQRVRIGLGDECPFSEIAAVQLAARTESTDGGAMLCFQLNLVLKDERRLTLMHQAGREEVAAAGKRLADFLGVQVLEDA